MEQLNYHKLVNLKKRFAKYDCEISKDILATIEKHLVIEKQKSINKKSDYQFDEVICEKCDKTLLRKSYYKHKCSCKGE